MTCPGLELSALETPRRTSPRLRLCQFMYTLKKNIYGNTIFPHPPNIEFQCDKVLTGYYKHKKENSLLKIFPDRKWVRQLAIKDFAEQ